MKSKTKKRSLRKSRSSKMSKSKSKKQVVYLQRSDKADKKFMVQVENKTIHFGANGMSDYTIHKDVDRMHRYEKRHSNREDWTRSGIKTRGFWSKWILWNKPGFMSSVRDTEKRFGLKIKLYIKEN
jgi:hypothetical protein